MTKDNQTRIKGADITPVSQVQFCQHLEARTAHKIKDCMHSLFFNPVRARLQVGDRITINQFESTTWDTLLAFVHVRVVKIDGGEVHIRSEGDMVTCDLDAPDVIDGEPMEVKIKKLASGRFAVTGLEEMDLHPEFDTRGDAVDWIERNSRTVYLDSGTPPKATGAKAAA